MTELIESPLMEMRLANFLRTRFKMSIYQRNKRELFLDELNVLYFDSNAYYIALKLHQIIVNLKLVNFTVVKLASIKSI